MRYSKGASVWVRGLLILLALAITVGVWPTWPARAAENEALKKIETSISAIESASGAPIVVMRSQTSGIALSLTTKPGNEIPIRGDLRTPEARALSFLQTYGAAFGISETNKLTTVKVEGPDSTGMEHVTFQKTFQGNPVTGAEIIVHLRETGIVGVSANDSLPYNKPKGSAFQTPTTQSNAQPERIDVGVGEPPTITTISNVIFTEKVADIMKREAKRAQGPQELVAKEEFEVELEQVPNPDAPEVASWPPPKVGTVTRTGSPLLPQTVGANFLGISGGESGSESGYIPPDSMGAVGPSQVIVAANGRIKSFDKTGALGALNVSANTFWDSVRGTSTPSDPHVRYDRLGARWYIVAITVNCPNRIVLAWSSGPTITDTTSFSFTYFIQSALLDYPLLGVDKNALYIGGNLFSCGGSLSSVHANVISKADILDGGTISIHNWTGLQTSGIWTPQGVDNDDPDATEGYFIGVDFNVASRLGIRRVTDPGSASPTLSSQINVTVPTTSRPLSQVQPGSSVTLDGLDQRLLAAAIHKNKITGVSTLWTAHGIKVNSSGVGGSSGDRNASRWYEIGSMTGTPTLLQSGTLFDSSATTPYGYWMPSIAMSGQGHAALGCSRASSSILNSGYAGISVVGRFRTDTLGTIQSPTLAQAGVAAYDIPWYDGNERWGDYSQVVVDPNDDQTMWTFQEYAAGNDGSGKSLWGVRAIQLKAPLPAAPASANPATVYAGQASVNVVITGTSTAGTEFFDPGPDTNGPGFANRIAAAVSGGVTVNSVAFDSPTQVTLNISTVGASAGTKNVTITNPDGQSATGNGILTVCAISLTPTSVNVSGSAGTGSVVVTASDSGCSWTAVSNNPPWLNVVSGSPGTGNGTVNYSFTLNTGVARTGTLTIGGQTFTVNQGELGTTGYFPVTPCRVFDTRDASGAPSLVASGQRVFTITGSCGIPTDAKAIVANVTVVNAVVEGTLSIIAGNLTSTTTTVIEVPVSRGRANNATIQLATDGAGTIKTFNNTTGTVDLVFDVTGYFR